MDDIGNNSELSDGDRGGTEPKDSDFLKLRKKYFSEIGLEYYPPDPHTQWIGDPAVAIMGFCSVGGIVMITDLYRANTRAGAKLFVRLYRNAVEACKRAGRRLIFATHPGNESIIKALQKRGSRIVGVTLEHDFKE